MNEPLQFLPGFDAAYINNYFFNDPDSIKEIFKITGENLGADIDKLHKAIAGNDLEGLRSILHSIKPVFNFVGMPVIEAEVSAFYTLSKQEESVNALKEDFLIFWPKLQEARMLIARQNELFDTRVQEESGKP